VYYDEWGWKPYVTVAERRRNAMRAMEKHKKQGHAVSPVIIEGRAIAQTFWGKSWCENLERYSDFANRLPRGRTYVRKRFGCRSADYARRNSCLGQRLGVIRSCTDRGAGGQAALEIHLQRLRGRNRFADRASTGRFSKGVMERICRQNHGLFPAPAEIKLSCSCPDWADMCKHVAAVLYGIGARLDHQPELLFRLRAVDEKELIIKAGKAIPLAKQGAAPAKVLSGDLSDIFGLDIAQSASAGAGCRAARGPNRSDPPRRVSQRRWEPRKKGRVRGSRRLQHSARMARKQSGSRGKRCSSQCVDGAVRTAAIILKQPLASSTAIR